MKRISIKKTMLTLFFLLAACSQHLSQKNEYISPPSQKKTAAQSVQLQTPNEIIETLNRLYNTSYNDCREPATGLPRGHYYCSGVIIRGTTDGDYAPWSYSPYALEIGATSWTWIRHDLNIERSFRSSGFILRNRAEAVANNLPGLDYGFICIYPFDALTSADNEHQGCGPYSNKFLLKKTDALTATATATAAPTENERYAWGSCDTLGIKTSEQWEAHFTANGEHLDSNAQCSWNADSPAGWDAMIESRPKFPRSDGIWNEFMISNQGDGSYMPQYITAFFYYSRKNCERGLIEAQHYQKKLELAGYKVPIVRIDYATAASNRFSYLEDDQVVMLYTGESSTTKPSLLTASQVTCKNSNP
jgi:hypothetical protein